MQDVQKRLLRSTSALRRAGVPYAVIGGNAVAAWVSRVDREAVRNTKDVDILLRRCDLDAATAALERDGFVAPVFLDGPDGKPSQGLHILFAGEKVRSEYVASAPDVDESEEMQDFRAIGLEALVRMKLTSFRDKDRTHSSRSHRSRPG